MNDQVITMYQQMLGVKELPQSLLQTYDNFLFMVNRVDGSTKSNPQILALIATIAGCTPKVDAKVESPVSPLPTQPPNTETAEATPDEPFPRGVEVTVFHEGQPRHGKIFSPSDKPDMIRVSLVNDTAPYREVLKKDVKLRE